MIYWRKLTGAAAAEHPPPPHAPVCSPPPRAGARLPVSQCAARLLPISQCAPHPLPHNSAPPLFPLQVREVWLSSEDTGAYGRDIGASLPELLRQCVKVLPEDGRTMLRVGMTNPPFILEHLDAIAEVGVVSAHCVV